MLQSHPLTPEKSHGKFIILKRHHCALPDNPQISLDALFILFSLDKHACIRLY